MVTYILLVTFTEQGRQNFKKAWNVTREGIKGQIAKLGGKMIGYVTAGPYDAVEILDMPNDDVALGALLGTLSVNDIRTVTMRAFHEDDVNKTLRNMP